MRSGWVQSSIHGNHLDSPLGHAYAARWSSGDRYRRLARHRRRDFVGARQRRSECGRGRHSRRSRTHGELRASLNGSRQTRSILRSRRRRSAGVRGRCASSDRGDTGKVDILVNNAGITKDHTARKMTIEEWQAVLKVNLSGPFFMIKAVLDHMLEQELRPHRQHQFGRRPHGQLRASELRRRQSRACSD